MDSNYKLKWSWSLFVWDYLFIIFKFTTLIHSTQHVAFCECGWLWVCFVKFIIKLETQIKYDFLFLGDSLRIEMCSVYQMNLSCFYVCASNTKTFAHKQKVAVGKVHINCTTASMVNNIKCWNVFIFCKYYYHFSLFSLFMLP